MLINLAREISESFKYYLRQRPFPAVRVALDFGSNDLLGAIRGRIGNNAKILRYYLSYVTSGEGGAPLEMLAPFLPRSSKKEDIEHYVKTGPYIVGVPLNILLLPPEGRFIEDLQLNVVPMTMTEEIIKMYLEYSVLLGNSNIKLRRCMTNIKGCGKSHLMYALGKHFYPFFPSNEAFIS